MLNRIGKSEQAINIYKEILRQSSSLNDIANEDILDSGLNNTNNYMVLNNLGFARITNGDYKLAIQNFDQAIRIKNDFAFAYNNRGFAYFKLNNLERAKSDIEHSIQLDNSNSFAYKNLALYYLKINKPDIALEKLVKAESLGYNKLHGDDVKNLIHEIKSSNQ